MTSGAPSLNLRVLAASERSSSPVLAPLSCQLVLGPDPPSLADSAFHSSRKEAPMRHLRDPENVCAGLLIVTFFLPWINFFGVTVAGYQMSQLEANAAVVWLIPVLALAVIAVRVMGVHSTTLSVLTGLLPPAGLLYLAATDGTIIFDFLHVGGWLTVLAGLGLVAAALGRQAQEPTAAGAEPVGTEEPTGERAAGA